MYIVGVCTVNKLSKISNFTEFGKAMNNKKEYGISDDGKNYRKKINQRREIG